MQRVTVACIETLLGESLKSGKMTRVGHFITLVGEREFDLEAITPLIEATLDLQHRERGSGFPSVDKLEVLTAVRTKATVS